MTEERKQAENEIMVAVRKLWQGNHEAFLLAAASSYAKGLRDGAAIMARQLGEHTETPQKQML